MPDSAVAAVAVLAHPDCARHDTGWRHPDHQGRLPAIMKALERDTPALLPYLRQQPVQPAPAEALLRVHTREHLVRVRSLAADAATSGSAVVVGGDTVLSGASWDAARAAAGCALDAVRLVMEGQARTAFALSRPPGHHATAQRMMGFCLFNNVAVATRALQARWGVERILIIDWDVHHGNGTQDIFYEDPSVYYLSLHQQPHYPGTGMATERGRGRGKGTTRNVPLPAGCSGSTYLETFEKALDEALAGFSPGFVLVSAGFDALGGDPLGGMLLEPVDYHVLTTMVTERMASTGGRVALVLEGGYLADGTAAAVDQCVRALAGVPPHD